MNFFKPFIIALMLLFAGTQASAGTGGLEAYLEGEILKNIPWERRSVEITDYEFPGFTEDLRFDSLKADMPKNIGKPGKVTMLLGFYEGGKEIKKIWASARIKVFRDVFVAASQLKKGHVITEDDMKRFRAEVASASGAIQSETEILGMTVKKPLSAGTIIKAGYIEPPAIVKKGEPVFLVVMNDKISIRSTAIASEDGHMGSSVRARTSSGKLVRGKVTAPKEISVKF